MAGVLLRVSVEPARCALARFADHLAIHSPALATHRSSPLQSSEPEQSSSRTAPQRPEPTEGRMVRQWPKLAHALDAAQSASETTTHWPSRWPQAPCTAHWCDALQSS